MTTLESLKNLAVASGCGECTSDNIADAIQFMADNYPQPVTNLFNINGNVNSTYRGESSDLNSVSNGVLTCNANSSEVNSIGQMIDTVVGKTYKFTCDVLSSGTGYGYAVRCYPYNSSDYEGVYENDPMSIELLYTATTDKTLFGFNTVGGTGAQFTDIEVREVNE